jgi:hypothetical protein
LQARHDLARNLDLCENSQKQNDNDPVPTTRQCPGSETELAISATERTPHTLPRWPCARGTTVIVAIFVVIIAATTVLSQRGLSSARGFTRRLRLCDFDALRSGRCRVLSFHGSWLFSFLFSLDCLSHTNILEGEWTKKKERKERREERGKMFNSQHGSRFRNSFISLIM